MKNYYLSCTNSFFEYTVLIRTADYYPFGMLMPERSKDHVANAYRYGYNGMEMDNEVKGNGNSYTTEFRQYDPRLGRWLSLDPLMHQFPWMSPYVAFNNNPVYFTDPLGLEGEPTGLPENAENGQVATADDGKSYMYGPDEEGNNVWTRSLGEVGTEAERPTVYSQFKYKLDTAIGEAKYKASLESNKGGKGSEWLKAMTLENHFGGGSNLRPFHDPLKTNPNHSMRESWEYRRAQTSATDNIIGGTLIGGLAAPIAIAGAVETAPIWLSYLTTGTNYALQGARLTGKYSWQALRSYHNIFGKNGGYLNIGGNYITQSISSGSMNPFLDHNAFEYAASIFVGKFSILNQSLIGAGGGLINWTPSENKIKHLFNQNIGITLGNVINGGVAPLYNLTGPVSGFIFGNTQQAIGGRVMNNLEKQLGELNSK